MAQIDPKRRTIEAKLVYYGTALGGKTTNLRVLHRIAETDQHQKLVSLNTAGERTLFFDLLPFELGKVLDWRIKLKLYTVPGQAEYNETRKIVLKGADAIIFVADSSPTRADENMKSVNFLRLNLKQLGMDPETIPLVFQYNKRDLPNAIPSVELEGALNWRGAPYQMAAAVAGQSVLETFEEACCLMVRNLIATYGGPRVRIANADDDIRHAVHGEMAELYGRRDRLIEAGGFAGQSARHVIVTSDQANIRPGKGPLESADLLHSALDTEMLFLNEMLDHDAVPVEVTKPRFQLDLAALNAAHHQAAKSPRVDQTVAPFLDLACASAGVTQGTVMLFTPGDGRLAEAVRLNLDEDPLNRQPQLGGPPLTRGLVRADAPLYGEALARATLGAALSSTAPRPFAAIPLTALDRKVGLLVLYTESAQPAPTADLTTALETIAMTMALALTVRGLEIRATTAKAPVPVAVRG